MIKSNLRFSILLICSLFSMNSFAWWDTGHMVVAEIAYQGLKPDVKNKVDTLVNAFNKEHQDVRSFQQMAAWPDVLHSQQKIYLYFRWHFINVPYSADGTKPPKNIIKSDNISWALRKITRSFSDSQASPGEEARLLAFLIHLVGDVHQPLHTVSRVSATLPQGDEGGNLYPVSFNGQEMNLHKLWDSGFGLYDIPDKTADDIKTIARSITNAYPSSYFGSRVKNLDVDTWIKEGMDNSIKYVYTTAKNKPSSLAYNEEGKHLVQKQTALAGYRLAALLNQLLENKAN